MSKDAAQVTMLLAFALAGLGGVGWFSYTFGMNRQEKIQGWLGRSKTIKRSGFRWGLYLSGAASTAIAGIGLWLNLQPVIWTGLYLLAIVIAHRVFYIRGKKAVADTDG